MLKLIRLSIKYNLTFITGFILLVNIDMGLAQETSPNINVKFISSAITIDGNDLEEVWETADSTYINWRYFPDNQTNIENKTQLKILYDNKNIYLMCKAFSKTCLE